MSVTAVPLRPIKKGSVAKLWLGLGILTLFAVGLAWWTTSGMRWSRTITGLQYQVIAEGEGPRPTATDVAKFDYVGRLQNGTEFDSSAGRGPAEIPIFGVVPGFAEGLQLMNKGATYRLRIPPELGYGPQGQPPVIPPNATIEFEVTLRDFRAMTPQEMQQIQMMQQMQQMQQQGIDPSQMMQGAPPSGSEGGAPGAGGPPPGAGGR
jgi:hypothetical protein